MGNPGPEKDSYKGFLQGGPLEMAENQWVFLGVITLLIGTTTLCMISTSGRKFGIFFFGKYSTC